MVWVRCEEMSPSQFKNLELLTEEAIVDIRALVVGKKRLAGNSLESLLEILNETSPKPRTFVHRSIKVDESFKPVNDPHNKTLSDKQNAKVILTAFQGLDAALATDERLWVTLALRDFQQYSLARWLGPGRKNSQELYMYFRTHVLASTARDRWRNHSIARLWWVANFAKSLGDDVFEKTIDVFYFNSDLGQQFLGRPNISRLPKLARCIVEVIHSETVVSTNCPWDRGNFRKFMTQIDLMIGRRKIEALPLDDILSEVKGLYTLAMSS